MIYIDIDDVLICEMRVVDKKTFNKNVFLK
jgi:hypothetical protein